MEIREVLLSHPTGNANVRMVAEALIRANLLLRFYTCVAIFEDTWSYFVSNLGPLKPLRRRSFTKSLKSYTRVRPHKEMGRMLAQRLGIHKLLVHEKGPFCIDKVYGDLDSYVSRNLQGSRAIYAYEDGALQSFQKAKAHGVFCLYDLPTGYWRAHRQLLEEERQQRPEWAMTLKCFLDSENKLRQKDEELALADAIFVASRLTKESLKLYPKKLAPVHLMPYGFPMVCENREYSSTTNRRLKLLFVGGLSQLKGIANLLEAAEILEDQVELTIVGKKVVQGCKPLEKGLAKHRWIPTLPHDEVLALMRQHDIFVFPSLFEGYGLVVSEAMSQGTPVITTNRTCGADFIRDGENGWLVEAGNTLDLVEKLMNILAQRESISEVGRAAMKTARKLPLSLYGERLVEAIKEVIKEPAHGR